MQEQGIEPEKPAGYFEPNSEELQILEKVSQETGVPLWWLKHKYFAESTNGYSPDGNLKRDLTKKDQPYGWFQVTPRTAKDVGVSNLDTFEGNATAAALTYKRLLRSYDGDPVLATAAYNRGARNMNAGGNNCWPDETVKDSRIVLGNISEPYRDYYAKPGSKESPMDFKRPINPTKRK